MANAFLKTDKFIEHYEWLKEAAKQYQIALSLLDNTELLCPVGGSGHSVMEEKIDALVGKNDFILYWDKDIPLGMLLQYKCESRGFRCLTLWMR